MGVSKITRRSEIPGAHVKRANKAITTQLSPTSARKPQQLKSTLSKHTQILRRLKKLLKPRVGRNKQQQN